MKYWKHWQRNLSIFSILILLGLFTWGWIFCHQPNRFPIRIVQINPTQNILHFVSQSTIQTIVTPYISQGFFNIPVSKLRMALLAQPGISQVEVTRRFPDQVKIEITEDQPVALYDHDSFIDQQGLIVTPELLFGFAGMNNLPVFLGPADQMPQMVDEYESFIKIFKNFKNLNIKITQLSLDNFAQWELIININNTNNLVIDCGNQDVLNRLSNFLKAYPDLLPPNQGQNKNQTQAQTLVSVDLRYSEGFALRWTS